MASTLQLAEQVGTVAASNAMQINRANLYRARNQAQRLPVGKEAAVHPRALSSTERAAVLAELCSAQYVDAAPAAAYAMTLEQGVMFTQKSGRFQAAILATEQY